MTIYRLPQRKRSNPTLSPELHARLINVEAHLMRVYQQGCTSVGGTTPVIECLSPLTPTRLTTFEKRYRIQLPEDYRAFLCMLGDGGPGPSSGIFSLDKALRYQRMIVPAHLLRTPFPHTVAYDPNEDPEWQAILAQATRGELIRAEVESAEMYLAAGTLALNHEASGDVHRLVVSGPTAGQMWLDARSRDQGFFPLHVTFLEWYERWLQAMLVP